MSLSDFIFLLGVQQCQWPPPGGFMHDNCLRLSTQMSAVEGNSSQEVCADVMLSRAKDGGLEHAAIDDPSQGYIMHKYTRTCIY